MFGEMKLLAMLLFKMAQDLTKDNNYFETALWFNFKGCDISEKAVNIGLKRISKYENSNKNS